MRLPTPLETFDVSTRLHTCNLLRFDVQQFCEGDGIDESISDGSGRDSLAMNDLIANLLRLFDLVAHGHGELGTEHYTEQIFKTFASHMPLFQSDFGKLFVHAMQFDDSAVKSPMLHLLDP